MVECLKRLGDGSVDGLSHDGRERVADLLGRFALATSEVVVDCEGLEETELAGCESALAIVVVIAVASARGDAAFDHCHSWIIGFPVDFAALVRLVVYVVGRPGAESFKWFECIRDRDKTLKTAAWTTVRWLRERR